MTEPSKPDPIPVDGSPDDPTGTNPAPAASSPTGTSTSTTDPSADAWADRVRALYTGDQARLWRSLVAWSSSPDVADEAVADAYAQLLRRGPEVRDPKAWVWRSAYRLAAGDLQRRRARAGITDGDDVLTLLPGTEDRLPDDALDLVRALSQLTDQQRRCVALVDVAGHTAPSAAEVLGTSAATVRVQLMRARRHLRTLLTPTPEVPTPEDEVRS